MTTHPRNGVSANGHSEMFPSPAHIGVMKATTAFGEIVGLMMHSVRHRQHILAELEWMVLPALVNNQFLIGETVDQATGLNTPAAVILWALVSADIDKRLSSNPGGRLTLKPEEWKSGRIPWLINAAGDQKAIVALAKYLAGERFRDRGLKLVGAGADGKPAVGVLRAMSLESAAPPEQADPRG